MYYVYDLVKNQYMYDADTLEELIAYIANKYNFRDFNGKISNSFLNDFNCTLNDYRAIVDIWGVKKTQYIIRSYTVFDEEMRIFDIRRYQKEILNCSNKGIRKYITYSSYQKQREKMKPYFRRGAIPYTGRHFIKYYGYRSPRTMNEMKKNSDPEYFSFSRKRRMELPTAWDDIPRNYSRSWKRQSKNRKQWMRKNL